MILVTTITHKPTGKFDHYAVDLDACRFKEALKDVEKKAAKKYGLKATGIARFENDLIKVEVGEFPDEVIDDKDFMSFDREFWSQFVVEKPKKTGRASK